MHVLIVPSGRWLPPDNPVDGIFQYHQASVLHRMGLRVGVIAPAPRSGRALGAIMAGQRNWPPDERMPFPVLVNRRAVPWPGRFSAGLQPFWNMYASRMVNAYVQRHGRPDLLHAHCVRFAGVACRHVARTRHLPYALTEHSSSFFTGVRRRSAAIVAAYRDAQARIMVSPFLGSRVEAVVGPAAAPWTYIPNMLDPMFEHGPDVSRGPATARFRFLCVAQFAPVKNHAGLIRAFAAAFGGDPNVTLRLGGSGPELAAARALAAACGVADQVHFLGLLTRADVRAEIRDCHALVLASRGETFGVALIEALASGRPVIAPSGSGPDVIVHQHNGILFRPGDHGDLVSALQTMHGRASDYSPEALRRDCLERFGAEAVGRQLIAVYENVLDGNHPV